MGHHLYSALGRVNPAWAAKPLFQSQKRKLPVMAQGGIGGGEKHGQIYQMKFFFQEKKKDLMSEK